MDRVAKLERNVKLLWVALAVAIVMPWIVAAAPAATPKKMDQLEVKRLIVQELIVMNKEKDVLASIDGGQLICQGIRVKKENFVDGSISLTISDNGPSVALCDKDLGVRLLVDFNSKSDKPHIMFVDSNGKTFKSLPEN